MKVSVVATVTIDASREQVYKYFHTLEYHHLWNPHMQESALSGPVREGMRYETTHLVLGVTLTLNNHVLKLVPNRQFEVEATAGLLESHVDFKLTSKGKRTLVTCTTTISPKTQAFAFPAPVLRLLARRELQSDLQSLKIAAEYDLH